MTRGLVVAFLAAGAWVVLVGAQQDTTFRAATHTVSVYATVIDAGGRLVPNLTKGDFAVFDNGKRQDLTIFKNDVQSITIVIMLDRSGSMLRNFDLVRDAAEHFVFTLLPADRARLGSFSDRVQIDPPEFTSDHDTLIHILHHNLQDAGPTPLWNATLAAMNALTHEEGRRVVLVFTDGKDNPGRPEIKTTLNEVIERSQAEEIMVYAIGLADSCEPAPEDLRPQSKQILFQGRGPGGRGGGRIGGGGGRIGTPIGGPPPRGGRIGGGPGIDIIGGTGRIGDFPGREDPSGFLGVRCASSAPDSGLRVLADDGGGGYFELHGTDDLSSTFARVADELHHQYLLGFVATALDGKAHKLEVHLSQSNLTARARKSYLATTDR
jgi:VWFA-related protein